MILFSNVLYNILNANEIANVCGSLRVFRPVF